MTAPAEVADRRLLADNAAVTGRSARAMLTVMLLSTILGCTNKAGSVPVHPSQPARASTSASLPAGTAPGAAGCRPPSPVTAGMSGLPQVEGTGRGASLRGLLMFPHSLPARVGDQEKIVWRMTGAGQLQMVAIGPDGTRHRLAWGPDYHLGSNWDKPGEEWGAGYIFTVPGCWDLRAVRGTASADVWLRVATR